MTAREQDGNGQAMAGAIQRKWGDAIKAGFQVVPNVLVRHQTRLGLDAIDVVVLLNLLAHWWEEQDRPFVSPATIGKRMKITTRTVERHLKKMENRNFLKRDPRGPKSDDSPYIRRYDLTPLVGKLTEASQTALTERAARRASERAQQV